VTCKSRSKVDDLEEEQEDSISTFHDGCRYRTFKEDYQINYINTVEETIFISEDRLAAYHKYSTDPTELNDWMHLVHIDCFEV
jgi:hypothetical protein